jgi:hypothetical protein
MVCRSGSASSVSRVVDSGWLVRWTQQCRSADTGEENAIACGRDEHTSQRRPQPFVTRAGSSPAEVTRDEWSDGFKVYAVTGTVCFRGNEKERSVSGFSWPVWPAQEWKRVLGPPCPSRVAGLRLVLVGGSIIDMLP